MIAPTMIGDAALAARLTATPAAWRAALADEADRLGRVLRDQVARSAGRVPISIAVENGADGVRLTMAMRSDPARGCGMRAAQTIAPVAQRSHRFRRRITAHAGPVDLKAALVTMSPAIHAGLAVAFRRALPR